MASRQASLDWHKTGLLLLTLCCAALTVSATSFSKSEGPLIIAHRGASGYAPENTMASFELAERLGSDFIELDVRMSRDGELVVFHDKTVDRTTKYTGYVHNYTLRELHGMDAGSFFSAAYSNEAIVSLEEVMDRFAGRIGILIEIKDPPLYPGIEEKLAEIVRRYELPYEDTAGIIIQSFDFEAMYRIHTLLPDIPGAVLIHPDQHPLSDETMDKLASYASYINYNHDLLNEEIALEIHSRNRKVMAWTIRNDQDMKRMKKLGVDGIITNYPD
ncbi:putative glycerophosphoryl diester phosphodiesterase YhdW [Paenibacillus albidus]|uniref:Glycerophosphoryl diester phosphodiesterase YhdW n=1 Tax=Paenibacillus albidus TaxID=2041023 RepID=A0A917FSN2_9BACL|nr:glycerophosphodiester phosphodiesterase family protein [Paenibacillus albidus]GGF98626.1 putative glycerophosphoryl diester phosphodiesterase YhdW [Paenibacillus albidus]